MVLVEKQPILLSTHVFLAQKIDRAHIVGQGRLLFPHGSKEKEAETRKRYKKV